MAKTAEFARCIVVSKEQKPGFRTSPVPAGKKHPGRGERLAKALRGNIAKRKFQARARGKRG
jgi:hypothetical protein